MNVQGNPGKNIPMDLHMEHLNPECNTAIAGLGATVTEQADTPPGQKRKTMLGQLEQSEVFPNKTKAHPLSPDLKKM